MAGRIGYWLANWAALTALWLLLNAKLEWTETLAGMAAAALAATGAEVARGAQQPRFLPQLRWLIHAWPVPLSIVKDCWILFRRLAAGNLEPGFFRTVPFDTGGEDARSGARRALAITLINISPNVLIVGIDRGAGVMLYHQMERDDLGELARVLGARV